MEVEVAFLRLHLDCRVELGHIQVRIGKGFELVRLYLAVEATAKTSKEKFPVGRVEVRCGRFRAAIDLVRVFLQEYRPGFVKKVLGRSRDHRELVVRSMALVAGKQNGVPIERP